MYPNRESLFGEIINHSVGATLVVARLTIDIPWKWLGIITNSSNLILNLSVNFFQFSFINEPTLFKIMDGNHLINDYGNVIITNG